MANRSLRDLPAVTSATSTDILHISQGLTDKSITNDLLSDYVLTKSGSAPVIVEISGSYTVSTTVRYQYIIATISSNATVTFPASYGFAQEITVKNNTSSTANVIGLPESQILYPGQEITYIWNGTAWNRRSYISSPIVSTSAPAANPFFIGQMYINTTNNNVYKAKGTSAITDWINVSNNNIETSVKTTNYTILTSDIEEVFIAQPNTSGNYGIRQIKAPANGASTSRKFRVEHGSNRGLVRVHANQDSIVQWFDWDGTDVLDIPLYLPGQYVEFFWNSNLGKWSVGDYNIKMPVGLMRRTDWTQVLIGGNGVEVDNLSTGNTLDGQVITESTSGGSAVVVKKVGSVIYYYDMQPLNFNWFTNDYTITASDGTTMQVNESGGTTINVNYSLVHMFNLPPKSIDYEVILSENNSNNSGHYYRGFGDDLASGLTVWATQTNSTQNYLDIRCVHGLRYATSHTSTSELGNNTLYYILPIVKF